MAEVTIVGIVKSSHNESAQRKRQVFELLGSSDDGIG